MNRSKIEERIDREVESYQQIITEIWRKIAPILGSVSLKAIVERAVKLTSAEFKFIDMVEVSDEGISLKRLRKEIEVDSDPQMVKSGFRELVVNMMNILSSLTGGILVNRLLREVEGLKELTEGRKQSMG